MEDWFNSMVQKHHMLLKASGCTRICWTNCAPLYCRGQSTSGKNMGFGGERNANSAKTRTTHNSHICRFNGTAYEEKPETGYWYIADMSQTYFRRSNLKEVNAVCHWVERNNSPIHTLSRCALPRRRGAREAFRKHQEYWRIHYLFRMSKNISKEETEGFDQMT